MSKLSVGIAALRGFAELVYRAVFIGSDSSLKHTPFLLSVVLVVFQILLAGEGYLGLGTLALLLGLQAVVFGVEEFLLYSELLAALPALWYFLTTLPFTVSISSSIEIGLRVFLVSISLTMLLQRLNPMELSYLLSKIGVQEGRILMPLTWKVIPHIMKDFQNALLVMDLKGTSFWKGIAISFVAVEEYTEQYEEGLFLKLSNYRPEFSYSLRATGILLLFTILYAFSWITLCSMK